MRILVVDDDESVRGLVRDVLEVEGHEVELAADGFSALRRLAACRPDAVVLDVMMPGMDGYAVLSRIRSSEVDGDLPVIMLTAAADDTHAWQAWSGGVDYFLAKPFEPTELLHFLDGLTVDEDSTVAG
jgi:DNA-binding response OmpR family regulator